MRLLFLALASACAAASAVEVRYSIVNLEAWGAPGTEASGAGAINDLGQVVGNFSTPGQTELRAFRYTDGLGFVDLGTAGWPVLHVAGINESGQFAAYGGPLGAFRYTDGFGYVPLGGLGGHETEAYGINNRGQVTGYSLLPNGTSRAFRFTDGVGMEDLGSLFGGGSVGYAINNLGWVAGSSDGRNAFLYREETGMVYLGPGVGRALNDHGTVAIDAALGSTLGEAYVWLAGQMLSLGNLGGGNVFVWGINEQDHVVGQSINQDGQWRAFLWNEAEGMVDLNSLIEPGSGWDLWLAADINNTGQIVGSGILDGKYTAFRLDPIPEPSTWTLLGLGVALLWGTHRRRHQRGGRL